MKSSPWAPLALASTLALFTVGVSVGGCLNASAAVPGDSLPAATSGAINVATAAATAVPTTPMSSRNAFILVNLGPNAIYCGWASTVTTTTGFPVAAGGGQLSIDVRYNTTGTTPVPKLWCIAATADQTSPLNTRYIEVK